MVDDASESAMSPMPNAHNSNGGTHSPRENGLLLKKMDHPDRLGPHSPRSGTSSNASTPSNKKMEEKPSTPLSKSVTPTNSNGTNGKLTTRLTYTQMLVSKTLSNQFFCVLQVIKICQNRQF